MGVLPRESLSAEVARIQATSKLSDTYHRKREMGYLQDVRQRLGSVAHTVGKHAATAGKIALTAAVVAGAAYDAHQTHSAAPIRGTSRITYAGPARHLDANMNPISAPSYTSTVRYGPHGGLM